MVYKEREKVKSNRAKATQQKNFIKTSKPEFNLEAIRFLKNLERARNYGNKRKYNKELEKLAQQHPEFAESITQFRWV